MMESSRDAQISATVAGPSRQPDQAPPVLATATNKQDAQPAKNTRTKHLDDPEEKPPHSWTLMSIVLVRIFFIVVTLVLLVFSVIQWFAGSFNGTGSLWAAYSDGLIKGMVSAGLSLGADMSYLILFHAAGIGIPATCLGFLLDAGASTAGGLAIAVYQNYIYVTLYREDGSETKTVVFALTCAVMILRAISLVLAVWATITWIKRRDKHVDYLNEKAQAEKQRRGRARQRRQARQQPSSTNPVPENAPEDQDRSQAKRRDKGKGKAVASGALYTTAKNDKSPPDDTRNDAVSIVSRDAGNEEQLNSQDVVKGPQDDGSSMSDGGDEERSKSSLQTRRDKGLATLPTSGDKAFA